MMCIKLRVEQAQRDELPIVDVDGSYVHKKYKSLVEAGKHVVLPPYPSQPLSD